MLNLSEAFGSTVNDSDEKKDSVKNFKMARKNLQKKLEMLINPVFYRIQQKYLNKLTGVKIEQSYENETGCFKISGRHFLAKFCITSPGFSKILIDINTDRENNGTDSKKFSFKTEEFDENLLEDLLEQFVCETKNY